MVLLWASYGLFLARFWGVWALFGILLATIWYARLGFGWVLASIWFSFGVPHLAQIWAVHHPKALPKWHAIYGPNLGHNNFAIWDFCEDLICAW